MPSKEKGIGIYHGPKVPMYKVRVTGVDARSECRAGHKVGDIWEISHVRRGGQASSSNKATSL